jgi:hypothetical protein
MTKPLSPEHKQRLEEIKKNLGIVGWRESNFVKAELLFYQAIEVARIYGDDENDNGLLAALKQIQAQEYQATKAIFKKSSQREQTIKRFLHQLKKVLSAGTKNAFANKASL